MKKKNCKVGHLISDLYTHTNKVDADFDVKKE